MSTLRTEKEAKTKWCPFARAATEHGETFVGGINREVAGRPDPWCLCIGNACAAWNWFDGEATGKMRRGSCGLIE